MISGSLINNINSLNHKMIREYIHIVERNNKIFDTIYVNKIHSFCGKIIFFLNEVYHFFKEKSKIGITINVFEKEKAKYQEKLIFNKIKS